MFLALVIMLPLFCLALAGAGEGLGIARRRGFTCERFGEILCSLAVAGTIFAILPPAFDRGAAVRPLFDVALGLGLVGMIFVRASRSHVPRLWFALAGFGSVATLSIWTFAPL